MTGNALIEQKISAFAAVRFLVCLCLASNSPKQLIVFEWCGNRKIVAASR
jgi:hypothetical protein